MQAVPTLPPPRPPPPPPPPQPPQRRVPLLAFLLNGIRSAHFPWPQLLLGECERRVACDVSGQVSVPLQWLPPSPCVLVDWRVGLRAAWRPKDRRAPSPPPAGRLGAAPRGARRVPGPAPPGWAAPKAAQAAALPLQQARSWAGHQCVVTICTWVRFSWSSLLLTNLTLICTPQLPASQEEVRDDKTTIKCETSPPPSPRSLRLDRLHKGALHTVSHEDIRDIRK